MAKKKRQQKYYGKDRFGHWKQILGDVDKFEGEVFTRRREGETRDNDGTWKYTKTDLGNNVAKDMAAKKQTNPLLDPKNEDVPESIKPGQPGSMGGKQFAGQSNMDNQNAIANLLKAFQSRSQSGGGQPSRASRTTPKRGKTIDAARNEILAQKGVRALLSRRRRA